MGSHGEQTLNQIAISVTDLRRTHQWYLDVFGFASAGGTELFQFHHPRARPLPADWSPSVRTARTTPTIC